ncbi:hypothetical protein [Picosynechococcus sp. PCC 73109]|uniref:hypothetical protein n=1 Tax=Picosynechococcus sp. PCC 73109 TaxID=374982 RepID=UPI0007458C46|nr:hypothetical protein [Picosynechococcus sp. PCC 73109]AMA10668.1 hypothetical protein AWQ23_14565 [Picosynechococcus sp. PCC 73109]
MGLRVPREQDVFQEAFLILEQNLPLSKMALLLSRWQADQGDYLLLRDQLFAGETVESLGEQILGFEAERSRGMSA